MPTVHQVEAFARHLSVERHRAVSTVRGYRAELLELVRRAVPLERNALGEWVQNGRNGLLAVNTRNRRLVVLRLFVQFLVESGELAADPTGGLVRARLPRSTRVAFTVDELRRAVIAARSETVPWRATRDEAVIRLLFATGLRINELRGLDLDQVDLPARLLRSVLRKGAVVTDVPLNDDGATALGAWIAVRPTTSSTALFTSGKDGDRLTIRTYQKRLAELGEAAGLSQRLHPHALRHAHATGLLRVGTSTALIQQSLSHASIATTQRYLHSDLDLLRAALVRLPGLGHVGPSNKKKP
ncbi:MAG: tyrosine-type recombinase/integrase [Thermoanaerobaculia bacterium]|jgi:integrase/recombinase XerC